MLQLDIFQDITLKNDYLQICYDLGGTKILSPDQFGEELQNWSHKNMSKINVLSLFSGAGGLDIGFENVGFNIIESVEIEKRFVETSILNKNNKKYFLNTNILCQDIKNYIPEHDNIDFIIGGPPCQSFSSAGRRAAGVRGTNDDRGSLFEEYVRILEFLKPKGFLFENVYGILGAQKGNAIKLIVEAFNKLGYTLSYRVLNAADYGTPQFRERLILVGLKSDIKFKFPRPTHGMDSLNTPYYSAKEALKNCLISSKERMNINGKFGHLLNDIPPGMNYSFFTDKMGHPNPIFAWRSKFSDFLYKADPEEPIRTLKASGGQYTGPFHWENRKFSIEELKRLQTFPDNYIFDCSYALAAKQIGNSVPPQFARFLALSIIEQVFKIELPFKLYYLNDNEQLSYHKQKKQKQKKYIDIAQSTNKDMMAPSVITKDYTYYASLDKKFKWERKDNLNGNYKVEVSLCDRIWKISILNAQQPSEIKYKIDITTVNNQPFFHGIKKIELFSDSYDIYSYTALWKSFEQILVENNIKADLVQFNGYYQYKNNYIYNLSFIDIESIPNDKKEIWSFISMICNNNSLIGTIYPLSFYEKELRNKKILSHLITLRDIGFEIRNSNTNPEIEINHFLIPYKFPTLTSLSVQLNKSL